MAMEVLDYIGSEATIEELETGKIIWDLRRIVNLARGLHLDFFGGISGFPEKPWVDLCEEERRLYIAIDNDPVFAKSLIGLNGVEKLHHQLRPGMSWDEALELIKKESKIALRSRHGGSGGPQDKLKQLAAWRLLVEAKLSMTAAMTKWREIEESKNIKSSHSKYPYKFEESWYKGIKSASLQLKGLDDFAKELQPILRKMKDQLEYATACIALKRGATKR